MSDNYKPRSLIEIVNDVLSTVRDYYDSEYVYYLCVVRGKCAMAERPPEDASVRKSAEMDEAGDHGYNFRQL